MTDPTVSAGLRNHDWRLSYRTSGTSEAGHSLDILREFYIPALEHAVRYDRVAGYFRSSSLAAASQGFSAFIGHQGIARFVVGADLDPGDVRAILAGDEARLAAVLNETLRQPETWPAGVERGVELLSWMVARGRLELKVALRVHRATGEPLPFGSVDDGYVHMKWGLLADEFGHRIYFSGSLNESRQALVRNAENIDVHCDWRNDDARRRADEAESEFATLWENRNPALRVLTLPEAVHQRLIEIGERFDRPHPGHLPQSGRGWREASGEGKRPSGLERLRFALLRDGPRLPGGRLVGLATAPVAPWPHQAVVARRLIENWPYSYLLCDEVGLGKTIEAGLAIRSLYLSGLVRRVLIAAPASLTYQWHREMAHKFLLPFARTLVGGGSVRHAYLAPIEEERAGKSLYQPNLTIVSTALMSRADRRRELERAETFDIALVDEAHYARRKNPQAGTRGAPEFGNLYQAIQTVLRSKSQCLWLATATPMQLDAVEAFDLLRLTRRGGAFSQDPGLTDAYYELLGRLMRGQSLAGGESGFLRRAVSSLRHTDPALWRFLEEIVLAGSNRVAVQRWLRDGREPRGRDADGIRRLVFAAAPLSQVMLRHTRSLLEIYRDHGKLSANLAEREILPLRRITFNDQEQRVYRELERYCRGLAQCLSETARSNRGRASAGFYLSFLRLRFASSLYAVRETLKRRLARVEATLACHVESLAEPPQEADELADILDEAEDDQEAVTTLLEGRMPQDLLWERNALQAILDRFGDLSVRPSKMTELLRVLNHQRRPKAGRMEQTVVFTRFYDTLVDIVQRLQAVEPGMLLGTYSGHGGQYFDSEKNRLVSISRDEVKQRFLRGEIDVLICTDAAAEGLNLQTANLLVNFDLPWNPMKVEQRIGRIDRIGQRHSRVFILNLCYNGSAEETVYGRLLERLTEAGLIVGTQQLSLLPVNQEEFAQLADGTLGEQELEQRARERAEGARQRTASMEIPAKDLYALYTRLEQRSEQQPAPLELDAIWDALSSSQYLQDLGCRVMPDPALKALTVTGLEGVGEGSVLTVDRTAFETGINGQADKLHFASYGDPVFAAILERFANFDLPGCVRRLRITVPNVGAQMVGFAVATRTDSGAKAVRLVTTYAELADLILDEAAILQEGDVEALRSRLARIAEEEFSQVHTLRRVEQVNEAAGYSQALLSLMIAKGLLEGRQRLGTGLPSFHQEMAAITQRVEQAPLLRVTGLSTQMAKRLVDSLFEMHIPALQSEMYIDAPKPLLVAAVDTAWRAANGLHLRRSALSTAAVISRLDREISDLQRRANYS